MLICELSSIKTFHIRRACFHLLRDSLKSAVSEWLHRCDTHPHSISLLIQTGCQPVERCPSTRAGFLKSHQIYRRSNLQRSFTQSLHSEKCCFWRKLRFRHCRTKVFSSVSLCTLIRGEIHYFPGILNDFCSLTLLPPPSLAWTLVANQHQLMCLVLLLVKTTFSGTRHQETQLGLQEVKTGQINHRTLWAPLGFIQLTYIYIYVPNLR